MKAPVFRGKVEKGRLVLDNRDGFKALIDSFEGKRIEIVLRPRSVVRSNEHNAAYWGLVIDLLCNHTGEEKKKMHQDLKRQFASHIDPETGLLVIESTARMSSKRFQKYYEDIQQWAAEFLGLNIPSPNEVDTK